MVYNKKDRFEDLEAIMNELTIKDLLEEERRQGDLLVGIETEDVGEELLDNNPYSPNDVRINQRIFSIYQIQHMIKDKHQTLFLNPDFQRNVVWDVQRKSLLIESIMLGIPISTFYFQEDCNGNKFVIDGLQRLSAISQFMDGGFELKGLQYLSYDGYKYVDLPQKYVTKIEDTQLVVYVLDSTCHELTKFDVFRRVNTGGVPLNSQEIRNSMATSGTRHLLSEMSHSMEFLKATRGRVKDIRMDAQELCLRFITFYMKYDFESGSLKNIGSLIKMLDQTILTLNQMQDFERIQLYEVFKKSMIFCRALLGDEAFSKKKMNHIINKPLFISWSVIMAGYDGTIDLLERQHEKAVTLQEAYFDDGPYFYSITSSTATAKSMALQFEGVRKIMEELNCD